MNEPARCILAPEALSLRDVHAFYGDSHILHGVSFSLRAGGVLALLGRNGAGKTTCISTIIGFLKPRAGEIRLFGEPINGLSPERISHLGIGLVPQGRRIFRSLTVRENLAVAARRPKGGLPLLWTVDSVLAAFPRLRERRSQYAGTLSGGEQQMLAIGRALVSNPRILLMDEPSEGLAPQIVAEVMATIRRLKEEGLSIVLVEQNAKLVFDLADDIVILNNGRVVVDAPAAELKDGDVDMHQHLGIY